MKKVIVVVLTICLVVFLAVSKYKSHNMKVETWNYITGVISEMKAFNNGKASKYSTVVQIDNDLKKVFTEGRKYDVLFEYTEEEINILYEEVCIRYVRNKISELTALSQDKAPGAVLSSDDIGELEKAVKDAAAINSPYNSVTNKLRVEIHGIIQGILNDYVETRLLVLEKYEQYLEKFGDSPDTLVYIARIAITDAGKHDVKVVKFQQELPVLTASAYRKYAQYRVEKLEAFCDNSYPDSYIRFIIKDAKVALFKAENNGADVADLTAKMPLLIQKAIRKHVKTAVEGYIDYVNGSRSQFKDIATARVVAESSFLDAKDNDVEVNDFRAMVPEIFPKK